MQSALQSAQTQLRDRYQGNILQHTQWTFNDIPTLSLESDVKTAGGRLTPSNPPQVIKDICGQDLDSSGGDNTEEMDTSSLGIG